MLNASQNPITFRLTHFSLFPYWCDLLQFTITTKSGNSVSVQADRCGGDTSYAKVEKDGEEVFRHSMPDDDDKAMVAELEKKYPGAMVSAWKSQTDTRWRGDWRVFRCLILAFRLLALLFLARPRLHYRQGTCLRPLCHGQGSDWCCYHWYRGGYLEGCRILDAHHSGTIVVKHKSQQEIYLALLCVLVAKTSSFRTLVTVSASTVVAMPWIVVRPWFSSTTGSSSSSSSRCVVGRFMSIISMPILTTTIDWQRRGYHLSTSDLCFCFMAVVWIVVKKAKRRLTG